VPRRPPLAPYAAAWLPLVVVYGTLYSRVLPPATAARSALLTLLPYALLGLAVLAMPRRLPWNEGRGAGFFLVHLALTVAYAAVGTGAMLALRALEWRLVTGRFDLPVERLNVAWQAVAGGLFYLAIAGGAYAWRHAERLRAEEARAAHADALRARAELAVLRSQLNPHFLLNTLHTALGLVSRDPAAAERALERLGEVLHYGLRLHRESLDQITLAEEWAFVRSYLEIESLRLGERLRLRLEIDAGTEDALVPPFVLQPLVENAVVHAVAPRRAGGTIAVAARRRGERLELEVTDDGPGLPASPPPGGLGLRTLGERLALLYAGDAHLSLTPAAGGGVRATIDLPLDREALAAPA
jgi:signal transduction histidine kinase